MSALAAVLVSALLAAAPPKLAALSLGNVGHERCGPAHAVYDDLALSFDAGDYPLGDGNVVPIRPIGVAPMEGQASCTGPGFDGGDCTNANVARLLDDPSDGGGTVTLLTPDAYLDLNLSNPPADGGILDGLKVMMQLAGIDGGASEARPFWNGGYLFSVGARPPPDGAVHRYCVARPASPYVDYTATRLRWGFST